MSVKQISRKPKLNVVLAWHMHQPEYRNLVSGEFLHPWTYLHGIKDYVDMAAHLENNPNAASVVNFTPILLDQIEEYVAQIDRFFDTGKPIGDAMLRALSKDHLKASGAERLWLVKNCMRINRETMVAPFEPFQRLAQLSERLEEHPELVIYAADHYFFDLVTWYHLAWIGETVRRQEPQIKVLMDKGMEYSLEDRLALLKLIRDLLASIVPRYKKLADRGQLELSTTPYAHPIVPLLLDIESATEATPSAPLPEIRRYPNGRERAQWHIDKGLETFERHFGFTPSGCWPSEGGVSQDTLSLLSKSGFSWVATGDSVLNNSLSLARTGDMQAAQDANLCLEGDCHHHAYQFGGAPITCFFRDDGLSDLIGFTYSNWHSRDAVNNLLTHLDNIHKDCNDPANCLVAIVLDGENAWEYYPFNGYYFLDGLFKALSEHPDINLTTFSAWLQQAPLQVPLPHLVAGSWVYGTFSTWIGETDKNRAWDLLSQAKRVYDQQLGSVTFSAAELTQLELQMAICEGSDWFWWLGEYNSSVSVQQFDELYRLQLQNLYQLMGVAPPANLSEPISLGKGNPEMGGVMRHGKPSGG